MKGQLFRVVLLLGGLGILGCGKGVVYPETYIDQPEIDDSLPFSFEVSAEHVSTSCKTEIADFLRHMDAIAVLPAANVAFVNVVREMELGRAESSNRLLPIIFLKHVSLAEEVRSAARECEIRVNQSMVEVYGREDLYRVVRAVEEKKEMLDVQDAQLLQATLGRFERNGLELPPGRREIFRAKRKTLIEIESHFQKNLDEWQDGLVVSRKELAGLPPDYIDTLRPAADGKYLVTLDYPHYLPFMEEARDANARKRLEYKFNQRGGVQNVNLLEQALRLRHELATMLGYQNHADLVLERTMAKTPERVNEFLEKLTASRRSSGRTDLAEMLAAKQRDVGMQSTERLESWDVRYYGNQLRKSKYGIDPQKLREWFPLDAVIRGMFSIYEILLGVQFAPVEGPRWHEDVKFFRVMQHGQTRAYFYFDLFPRTGKYGHAASFTLLSGLRQRSGAYRAPVSAVVANFTTPADNREPLLTHNEMETLFHEFGHLMHQTLTTARYATFSGSKVKQDFVETPSKMFEQWLWQPEMLKRVSSHYRTGEPLPAVVLDQLIAWKLHDAASRHLRQAALAAIDLIYHTSPGVDTTTAYAQAMRDIRMVAIQEGTHPQASFDHLMSGYGGTYYSYLWSESIARDMFQRFQHEGLLNPIVGADFRKWILEPGCTQDPYVLVRGFLGREPNQQVLWN